MQMNLHQLDLHIALPSPVELFSDEQAVLSEKDVLTSTSSEEKLLDRSEKLRGVVRTVRMSSQASREEVKNAWAFAVSPVRRKRQSMKIRNQAIITACSKEAKVLGIRAGMRYEEAKALLPELRILVYGRV